MSTLLNFLPPIRSALVLGDLEGPGAPAADDEHRNRAVLRWRTASQLEQCSCDLCRQFDAQELELIMMEGDVWKPTLTRPKTPRNQIIPSDFRKRRFQNQRVASATASR